MVSVSSGNRAETAWGRRQGERGSKGEWPEKNVDCISKERRVDLEG